jgi:hypothetical protein
LGYGRKRSRLQGGAKQKLASTREEEIEVLSESRQVNHVT